MAKEKPIVIRHMRLDYELARDELRRIVNQRKEGEGRGTAGLYDDDLTAANAVVRRIKEINRFLGERENAHTAVRLRGAPITILIEKGSAKGEELMAAQDIETAFFAVSAALMVRSPQLEKIDRGHRSHWPATTEKAVARYQTWANHWSARRKAKSDYTLECVIAAIIDQRPIRTIAEDLGFGHARISRAVLCGLRDYAARAGWVEPKVAAIWIDTAAQTFN